MAISTMRHLFSALFALLVLACSTTMPPAPFAAPRSHADAAWLLETKTVALVRNGLDGGVQAFCSGVWVSPTSILTANHCVDELGIGGVTAYSVKADALMPDGVTERPFVVAHVATLYTRDAGHDLALLRAAAPAPHGIAATSTRPIEKGDFAQTMGHAMGLWYSYSSGDIAAIRQVEINDMDALWVQATTPISPGNSGCGLFDVEGSLIGIAHGTFTRGELLNVFIHPQYIDALLHANRSIL